VWWVSKQIYGAMLETIPADPLGYYITSEIERAVK